MQPTSNGACVSPNSIPVYRSFRPGVGGRSPNHRYSITRERFDALTAAGWAPEGVVFCAPIAAPSTEPAQASFKRTVSAAASPLAGDCRDWPTGSARVGSEASTQLAINPGNPRHLTATWLQDTGNNGASRGTASAVSFDAGQSWQTSSPKFTRCSGGNAAIGGDFERVTDIATVLTSDGLALQIARVASGELYTTFARSAIMIARSSNGGRNWDEMATLAIEPTPTYNLDKPVLVADADDSRYLHAAWWRTNVETGVTALRYTRTSDTGYIWTDPVQILTNVPGSSMNQGRLLSLPNGVLVYAYIDVVRLSPNPQLVGSWLRVIRSSDRGQTWSAPITVSRAESVGTTSADRTRVARDSAGLVSIAGRGNKVYLAWQDSRVGGGSHDGIVLARSTDGGANWWDAVRVNGSDTIPAFTPTVSVRRDGIVAVSYYELASASALPSSPMPVAFPTKNGLLLGDIIPASQKHEAFIELNTFIGGERTIAGAKALLRSKLAAWRDRHGQVMARIAISLTLRWRLPCCTTHAMSRSLTPCASVIVSCIGMPRRSSFFTSFRRSFSGLARRSVSFTGASVPSNCSSTSTLSRSGTSQSAAPAFANSMPFVGR